MNITSENIFEYVRDISAKAKKASHSLACASTAEKNAILKAAGEAVAEDCRLILEANAEDMANAKENGVPDAMLDRLKLTDTRIKAIADSVTELIDLPDPCGTGERIVRPNGLIITKTKVPLGTIGMIYEARPNVTADAALLCIKSGNACVLRCGKEAINSSRAIVNAIHRAITLTGFDCNAVGFIDSTLRDGSNALMQMRGYIDALIPRGGKGLIRSVVENSKVPVIETGAGNCHLYVDSEADIEMAVKVALNAKLSRPSVCNAIETILLHRDIASAFITDFAAEAEKIHPLEIRGDEYIRGIIGCAPASEEDYDTEYDDYIVAVKTVDSLDEAIEHISRYGTGHSEAIITDSYTKAKRFQREVDAAAVYVNASTRFTDGGCFGFGAEIGISTQKLHARGPMGLNELTTVKYLVDGDGQIR